MEIRPISGMITVPRAVIKRLPMYHRFLNQLVQEKVEKISSRELSQLMGITSSQLRQDLSHFGEFGQQGYGYNVLDLNQAICNILGLEKAYKAVIVGGGNIGKAIANYAGFKRRGLEILRIFDIDQQLIGHEVNGVIVEDLKGLAVFLDQENIDIGIIATPAEVAQEAAQVLMAKGVKGIWNFAPVTIKGSKGVIIEDIFLGDSLLQLFYRLSEVKHKMVD